MIKFILLKLNNGHERTIKARKNIIESFLTKIGSVAINFALVPVTIHYVTPAHYGIWLTLSSIIAWFSFFDIGFGNGLRNKFAQAVAMDDKLLARTYVSTTYGILSLSFLLIWALFIAINNFVDWGKILNTDLVEPQYIGKIACIVFSFFCLQFVMSLVGTVLAAYQKPAKQAFFNFIANFLFLITIVGLSYYGYRGTLGSLAILNGSFQVLVLSAATIWFFSSELKEYSPRLSLIKPAFARPLLGLGLNFFAIQVAAVLMFQTTNVVIAQLFGAEQVTVYNIAFKYFSISTMLFGIVTTPFWSAFTEAYTKGDYSWIAKIVAQLDNLWYLIIVLLLFMLVCSQYIFHVWVGDQISVPWTLSIIIALTMIFNTRYSLYIILINGVGKVRLQLITNIILGILFVPLSIILGKQFGLSGVVSANLITSIIYAIIAPIQGKKIISQSASGIWNK